MQHRDAGCAPECSLGKGSSRAGSKTLSQLCQAPYSPPKGRAPPSSLPEARSRCEAGSSSEAQAAGSCPSCTGPCCRSPRSPHRTDSSTGAHLQSKRDGTSGSSPPNPRPSFTCPGGHKSACPEPESLQAGCHHTPQAFRVMPASSGLLCTSGWPPSQREGPVSPCPQGHRRFSKGYPAPTQSPQRAGDRRTQHGRGHLFTWQREARSCPPALHPSSFTLLSYQPG